MKNNLLLLILLLAWYIFIPSNFLAQTDKPLKDNTCYFNLDVSGDQSKMKLSLVQPGQQKFSKEKQLLLEQLEGARKSNNIKMTNQIQSALNEIDGTVSTQQPSDPRGYFVLGGSRVISGETDYNIVQINGISDFSNAVATVPVGVPNGGRIWVASTNWRGSSSDSIKFYYSDNNGNSWNYFGLLCFINYDFDFVSDELDIEAVYDGTNVWMFGVAGIFDNIDQRNKCVVFRFNSNGTGAYINLINYAGISSPINNYYNPRLCTDNTNYQASTFAYIICSQDSLAAATHHIKQQYVYLTNIFAAAPTFNFKNPSGSSGFYWSNNGTANRIYLYGDIGYYLDAGGTGHNRVMTILSDAAYGFNDMYLAWSDDYGSTIAGNLVLPENQPSTGARIAFNGGQNRTGMIVYRARYNGGPDWDIVYRNTATGGTTTGAWNSGYIDFTSYVAKTCDIIALRNANNVFKAAYSQNIGATPYAYYSAFSGSWSTPIQVSNVQTDTINRKPRAGYTNNGTDDCLTIWAVGTSTYASRLCNTTVGINNNETPVQFSLSQNYPNPFNPNSTIKFSLAKSTNVVLKVYNILGEVVSVLVNGYKQQGTYNMNFDASNLSSGIYIYKIETEDFTDSKKMLLVK